MRKAINFDIDTKKYEKLTRKKSPNAYKEISDYFMQNDFIHRQGSGYISKNDISMWSITIFIKQMSKDLYWLKYCIKEIDVTNIGRQHSLLNMLESPLDEIDLLFDFEPTLEQKEIIYQYVREQNLKLDNLFNSLLNFV